MTVGRLDRLGQAQLAYEVHSRSTAAAGPPLVFVPGWLCTRQSWVTTAERLSASHVCVTVDLPGFGASSAAERRDWSLASYGADLVALVEHLGFDQVVLVGHSMGGAVAVEAAVRAPTRVAQVVAVDSLVYPTFYEALSEPQISSTLASFLPDFSATVASVMAAYLQTASPPATLEAVAQMSSADPETGLAVLREFLRWDVAARLRSMRGPLAIIAAEPLLSTELADQWRERCPVELVAQTGHFIMLDQPDRFDAALRRVAKL